MRKLFIAKWTVRFHISSIRKKLDGHSIHDVVRLQQIVPVQSVSTLRFSPRGKEVFLLIREGLPHKLVAERLGMSVNGVKRHREKMLLQNKCATMLELIAKYHGMEGINLDADRLQE
jgi:DNA-binding CsgD family transcriptional regulator